MSKQIDSNLLAFDADGVLLDYHASYAKAYAKAFGVEPTVADPLAYWPRDRYAIPLLEGQRLEAFRAAFDEQLWSSMDALPGALEALSLLAERGFRLVCVTAVRLENLEYRKRNLSSLGFEFEEVVSCPPAEGLRSPKAHALARLSPAAFVDDYLPYFDGAPSGVHLALIDRSPNGSPNFGPARSGIHSAHADAMDFARYWLDREHR